MEPEARDTEAFRDTVVSTPPDTKGVWVWTEQFTDLPAPLEIHPLNVPPGSIIRIAPLGGNRYFVACFARDELMGEALAMEWKPGEPLRFQENPPIFYPVNPERDRVSVVSVPTERRLQETIEKRIQRNPRLRSPMYRRTLDHVLSTQKSAVKEILQRSADPPRGR